MLTSFAEKIMEPCSTAAISEKSHQRAVWLLLTNCLIQN